MPEPIHQRFGGEKTAAWIVVALALLLNAYWLAPELDIARVDLNDNVLHYAVIERVVNAIENGENPFDHWVSAWTLGYPLPRTYQPLPSFSVAVLYLALGKTVPLLTLFTWIRFLLVLLFPLTIYVSARLMEFDRLRAAAAALIAPLVASSSQFGLESGSYVWRGGGLYTQSWAMHGMLLTLGFGYRAFTRARGFTWAGGLLGLTFLLHFIYGYMAALSLVLMALVVPRNVPFAQRAVRLAWIAAVAIILTASFLLPLAVDAPYINHSRWEAEWKWNSYGFFAVMRQILTGELLDFGRIPVLTLLAAMALVLWIIVRRNPARTARLGLDKMPLPALDFVVSGTTLWLLLYCGRVSWGPLFSLLAAGEDVQLHRLIGGVHAFAILLGGIALGSVWRLFVTRRLVWGSLVTILVLAPAWSERNTFFALGSQWGRDNLAAEQKENADLQSALGEVKSTPGRTFAGLAGGWGKDFRIGSTPLFAFLARQSEPAIGMLYHAMSLTADIAARFNEWRPDHYRLFNVTSVIADSSHRVAGFLMPASRHSRLQVYSAPGSGYFDLVQVLFSAPVDKRTFYDVSDGWMQGDWVEKRQHIRLDFAEGVLPQLMQLNDTARLPAVPPSPQLGEVGDEPQRGEIYSASARVRQACYLLFKMTYHPNWRVYINGEPRRTVMLSPGMVGVALDPGDYRIECRYEPEFWRTPLLFAGLAGFCLLLFTERRTLPAVEGVACGRAAGWRTLPVITRERIVTTAGIVALALPICIPLLTRQLLSGHDTYEYLPRLVEFHENIRNGILVPRWAPDLSAGLGQPFFVFNPPLLYYFAEVWLLLGVSPVLALNLTCALIVIASAAAMYRVARYWFGIWAAWIAAAAYIYAPYFHVDLFVRHALAEFAAFPFYPLAFYGFSRFAREREVRYLVLGALGYAGVMATHHPAALLFSPLLLGLVIFESARKRSWKLFFAQAGGILLALGLGASVWLPAMFERQFVHLDRLLEGYLLFTNHFVYLHQFLDPSWGYGFSQAGYPDGMSFSLGWSHILVAAVGWMLTRRMVRDANGIRRRVRWLFAAMLVFCGFMLPGMDWFWQHLPLLKYIEFPWRMLAPVAFCLALLLGAVMHRAQAVWGIRGTGLRTQAWIFAAAMASLVMPNLHHVAPARFDPVNLNLWTAQQIASRGIHVTTRNEYEPRWVIKPAAFRTEAARVLTGSASGDFRRESPTSWSGEFKTEGECIFEVSCHYFPGWKAWLDGAEIPVTPDERSGLIHLRIPAGSHRLELNFVRTPVRMAGDGLSALCGLILAAGWILGRLPGGKRMRSDPAAISGTEVQAS